MIKELKEFGIRITIYDPYSQYLSHHDMIEYQIDKSEIIDHIDDAKYDGVIYAVSHKEFKFLNINKLLKQDGIVFDIKSELDQKQFTYYKCL
jgi:UDP-N-acetyl-D-galactosamine dehydrogenase